MPVAPLYAIMALSLSALDKTRMARATTLGTTGKVEMPKPWANAIEYPDIRGVTMKNCGTHVPYSKAETRFLPYICDPDRVLRNRTEVVAINERLHRFSMGTPCRCQRMSQCTSEDARGKTYNFGFVAAIAFLWDIKMDVQNPSEENKINTGHKFVNTLRRRWSMGDCGNSVIILYWQRYEKLFVSTGRVAETYLNDRESFVILTQARHKMHSQTVAAVMNIIDNFQTEFRGDPDSRVDVGTWSLMLTVSVALFFIAVVTGCVCAFRCCGNLTHEKTTTAKEAAVAGIQPFRMDFLAEAHQPQPALLHHTASASQHTHSDHNATPGPRESHPQVGRAAAPPPGREFYSGPPPPTIVHQHSYEQEPQYPKAYNHRSVQQQQRQAQFGSSRTHSMDHAHPPPPSQIEHQYYQVHHRGHPPSVPVRGQSMHSIQGGAATGGVPPPLPARMSPVNALQPQQSRRSPQNVPYGAAADSKPPFAHAQLALYDETTIV